MERNNYLGTRHFMLSHSLYTYPSSFFLVVMKVARCLDILKYTGFSSSATELEDDAFPKGLRLCVNDRLKDFVSKSFTCDFHIHEKRLQVCFLLRLKYRNYSSVRIICQDLGILIVTSNSHAKIKFSVKTGSCNMYLSDIM